MITLSDILYKTGLLEVVGNTSIGITGLTGDSRQVGEGFVFVAVKGLHSDGHDFIGQAIQQGAVAVVAEQFTHAAYPGVTLARVSNSAQALAQAAANYYGNPSAKLKLVGITGTNGKTTIATLCYQIFRLLGYKVGLLSTVENLINDKTIPATHTTPDPLALNALLARMVSEGCEYAFMEVSSHAIVQHRISGLSFRGGVFSNLSRDHLDYHQTFKNYLKAKQQFFDALPAGAFALTNKDDRNGLVMVQNSRARIHSYGMTSMADFKGRLIESQLNGTLLNFNGKEFWSSLVGSFNAANQLAVFGTAVLLGQEPEDIIILLSQLQAVAGRFDTLHSPGGITAIVDYAHTPDALDKVLKTITELRTFQEKLITVVGAGGDRDRGKRPLMAAIAAELSDKLILTSDNPRSEDPELIIEEMRSGLDPVQKKKVLAITSRKEAILAACHLAGKGDIILVAGKGHEKYQEIKGIKHPFDDRQILTEALSITDSKQT